MAAIFSSVSSSQRSGPARRSSAARHAMTRSGVTMRSTWMSWPVGAPCRRRDLQLVHGGDDEACRRRRGRPRVATANSRSLKPPPLPSRAPSSVDRDAAGDDEVDGLELVDPDRARAPRRALDRRRLARACRRGRRGRAGRTGPARRAAARPCRRPCRPRAPAGGPATARRRGCTSGCAHAATPRSPAAAPRPPPPRRSSGCGPSPGNRASFCSRSDVHTRSRIAALASLTSAGPPASASCRLATGAPYGPARHRCVEQTRW